MTRKTTTGVVHFAPRENGTAREDEKAIEVRQVCFDGILSAGDVQLLSGLSRVSIWRMERLGQFPARIQVSTNRVGWYGSEILEWINSRPRVSERASR